MENRKSKSAGFPVVIFKELEDFWDDMMKIHLTVKIKFRIFFREEYEKTGIL